MTDKATVKYTVALQQVSLLLVPITQYSTDPLGYKTREDTMNWASAIVQKGVAKGKGS